jgi:hypothetical protein
MQVVKRAYSVKRAIIANGSLPAYQSKLLKGEPAFWVGIASLIIATVLLIIIVVSIT